MELFRFDAARLIATFGLQRPKISGDDLMAECPNRRNHDKGTDVHRSFGINLDTGEFHCYSCNIRGLSLRSLANWAGIDLPKDLLTLSFDVPLEVKKEIKEVTIYNHAFPCNPQGAFEKLKHRGVSMEAILKTEVTYIPEDDKLIFPCKDVKGRMPGWVIRSDRWTGRYGAFPEGVQREFLLFGLVKQNPGVVYLCEGPVDALKLISWGYNAIATCGNRVFKEQADYLIQYAKRVVLVPDLDKAGRIWWKDALRYLKGKLILSYILVNGFKDVGDEHLTKEMFLKYPEKMVGSL